MSKFDELVVDLAANLKHLVFNLGCLALNMGVDLDNLLHTLLYIFLIGQ